MCFTIIKNGGGGQHWPNALTEFLSALSCYNFIREKLRVGLFGIKINQNYLVGVKWEIANLNREEGKNDHSSLLISCKGQLWTFTNDVLSEPEVQPFFSFLLSLSELVSLVCTMYTFV